MSRQQAQAQTDGVIDFDGYPRARPEGRGFPRAGEKSDFVGQSMAGVRSVDNGRDDFGYYKEKSRSGPVRFRSELNIQPGLGVGDNMLIHRRPQGPRPEVDLKAWAYDDARTSKMDALGWLCSDEFMNIATFMPSTSDVAPGPAAQQLSAKALGKLAKQDTADEEEIGLIVIHSDMDEDEEPASQLGGTTGSEVDNELPVITQVGVTHQMEPLAGGIQRAHQETTFVPLVPPTREGKSTLLVPLGPRNGSATKHGESLAYLEAIAVGKTLSSTVSTALGDATARRLGKLRQSMGPLYVHMWLLQLDIVGGSTVDLTFNADRARMGIRRGVTLEREAAEMHFLRGVRIHADTFEALAYVLLQAACERKNVAGCSKWVERYNWVTTDLTVYGAPLQHIRGVSLNGRNAAIQVAATIIAIADKYDDRGACAAGYQTALLLYGDRGVNSCVELKTPLPDFNEDVCVTGVQHVMPSMCASLANPQIAVASKFYGVANLQLNRDLARVFVRDHYKVADVDDHKRTLQTVDWYAGQALAKEYGDVIIKCLPYHLVEMGYYYPRSLRVSWAYPGILANLTLGRVKVGSISHSATTPLRVPTVDMLQRTDIAAYAKDHMLAVRTMWLLGELINGGGANLCRTWRYAVPSDGGQTVAPTRSAWLAGTDVQFMITGFQHPLSIPHWRKTAFTWDDGPEEVDLTPQVTEPPAPRLPAGVVERVVPYEDHLVKLRNQPDAMPQRMPDLLRSVHDLRGPKQSTTFRKTRPTMPMPVNDTSEVFVGVNDQQSATVLRALAEDEVGPGMRQGTGVDSALIAMQEAITVAGGRPDYDEITRTMYGEMSPEQLARVSTAAGRQSVGVTSEQITRTVSKLGYGSVIVELGPNDGALAVGHGLRDDNVVLFHDGANWIGPRQGSNHKMIVATDAGVPRTSRFQREQTPRQRRGLQLRTQVDERRDPYSRERMQARYADPAPAGRGPAITVRPQADSLGVNPQDQQQQQRHGAPSTQMESYDQQQWGQQEQVLPSRYQESRW